jgi:UDP-N-acetyl-D-galactosamine dehydrogenase
MARVFNVMGIDTHDVIEAAASKWNFIKLSPGLVGGHCISVDPYYLIQKAQVYGVWPRIMMTSRRLNDTMGEYVAEQVIKLMNKKGVLVKDAKILILGVTFKENCPDIRNTKVVDIYKALKEYSNNITVYDPWANAAHVEEEYHVSITNTLPNDRYNVIILSVAHKEFLAIDLKAMLLENGLIYDVKGILPRDIVDGRL